MGILNKFFKKKECAKTHEIIHEESIISEQAIVAQTDDLISIPSILEEKLYGIDDLQVVVKILSENNIINLLNKSKLYCIINDLSNVFRVRPQYNFILRTLLDSSEFDINKFKSISENELNSEVDKIANKKGFSKDLLQEIFTKIANGLDNNIKPIFDTKEQTNTNENATKTQNKTALKQQSDLYSQTEHIEFMGFEFGKTIKECVSHFSNKFHLYQYEPKRECKHFFPANFLGKDCEFIIDATPVTKLVYKITIKLPYATSIPQIINDYNYVLSFYKSKYGLPSNEYIIENEIKAGNCSFIGKGSNYNLNSGNIFIGISSLGNSSSIPQICIIYEDIVTLSIHKKETVLTEQEIKKIQKEQEKQKLEEQKRLFKDAIKDI